MMDALNKYLDILNTQLDAIECSRMLTDQWDRLLALRGERVGEYNLIDTYIDWTKVFGGITTDDVVISHDFASFYSYYDN